jgi:hypothetical protein
LILGRRIGALNGALAGFVEDDFGLGERKSRRLDVEVEINETLQLDRERLAVLAGI